MKPLQELIHVIIKSIPAWIIVILHHLLWQWIFNYYDIWYITAGYIEAIGVNFIDILIVYYYFKLLKVVGLHK
jgi:hypothetical protein